MATSNLNITAARYRIVRRVVAQATMYIFISLSSISNLEDFCWSSCFLLQICSYGFYCFVLYDMFVKLFWSVLICEWAYMLDVIELFVFKQSGPFIYYCVLQYYTCVWCSLSFTIWIPRDLRIINVLCQILF